MSSRFADLIQYNKSIFQISLDGPHGHAHWARVKINGDLIAENTPGVDPLVTELFAWCHDVKRETDMHDLTHGPAAAKFVRDEVQGKFVTLTDLQLELLCAACEAHSDGHTDAHPTIQACWDADRLDLARVGMIPDPRYLCTEYAKRQDVIEAAIKRSYAWLDKQ